MTTTTPTTAPLHAKVRSMPSMRTVRAFVARRNVHVATVTVALLVIVAALLLALIVLPAPTLGGGDYGQWLMVARPFRGLDVPAYRDIGALPPLVPAVTALLWTVTGNPVVALDILNGGLLVGMVGAFAAVGYALYRHPVAAVVAPLVGLLVFDRFAELFAFGGILQLAADAASLAALAALIAAEARRARAWHLQVVAVVLLDVSAFSHVGTTESTVPVFLALTAVFGLRAIRRSGLRGAIRGYGAPLLLAAPAAIYWLVVLLPANSTYFTNPATAAYRDAGSFVTGLFAYGPDAIVLAFGCLALAVGLASDVRARRFGPWTILAIWAAVAWAELGALVVVGTATDFPRFATALTPPLLLAVAGAIAVLLARVVAWRGSGAWPTVVVAAALVVSLVAPVAAQRDAGLSRYYGAPSAASLDSAVQALQSSLGQRTGTVLTSVRAGKWLEGTTGLPSLFSQPTRFAVRPAEWQRSLDAEVLANAAAAIASPAFLIEYQHAISSRGHASVGDLVIAANHDGEWVDLFASLVRDTFVVDAAGAKHSGSSFDAKADAMQAVMNGTASIATSWVDSTGFSMGRTVSVSGTASTARLLEPAYGVVTTRLYPADGITIVSITPNANTATVCFTVQGRRAPCVDLVLADPTGTITPIGDGGLWIRGGTARGLDLTITNLTVGTPIVGLESLSPAAIAQSNGIVGAILETTSHGYADAAVRLVSLGFQLIDTYDRYAVFVRPPA
jgi:hypothetical protein